MFQRRWESADVSMYKMDVAVEELSTIRETLDMFYRREGGPRDTMAGDDGQNANGSGVQELVDVKHSKRTSRADKRQKT